MHVAITNKAACVHSKHDDQDDDKMNTLAFINILLIKIFSNPDSSKFCAVKILRHTVYCTNCALLYVVQLSLYELLPPELHLSIRVTRHSHTNIQYIYIKVLHCACQKHIHIIQYCNHTAIPT